MNDYAGITSIQRTCFQNNFSKPAFVRKEKKPSSVQVNEADRGRLYSPYQQAWLPSAKSQVDFCQ
jgi:hypothetical protein